MSTHSDTPRHETKLPHLGFVTARPEPTKPTGRSRLTATADTTSPPVRLRLSFGPHSGVDEVIDLRDDEVTEFDSEIDHFGGRTAPPHKHWLHVSTNVTVSVIIPTLNEAKNLRILLPQLPPHLHEVIVIDGYSTDDTLDVVKELYPSAKIVKQNRRGKGNALAHGFAASTGDIIVMLDADCSADPHEIPWYVMALLNGADFVKGSRYACGGGSSDLTMLRNLGNAGLSAVVNTLYGTRYTDLCYGYNVFWRHCLDFLELDEVLDHDGEERIWGDGFEIETLIMTRIAKAGLRIVEIPSFEHDRAYGESNLQTFKDGWRVLRTAIAERVR